MLAKPGTEISVGDILRALEGDLSPVKCMGLKGDQACSGSGNCVTKNVWKRIDDSIQNAVDSIYLNELVEDNRKIRLYGRKKFYLFRPCGYNCCKT